MFAQLYQNRVLKNPKIVFILLVIAILSFGYYSKDFRLDASSETLLIEGDPDLAYLKEVTERYGSKDFLILTYTPNEGMVTDNSINNLLSLKYKIQSLNWVHSVITLLDVPLLSNSDAPLQERLESFKTLKDEGVDKNRGFKEILNSPVFRNFVISENGNTSGIIVNIKENIKLENIENLSKSEIESHKDKIKKQNHENILEIRQVIKSYGDVGKIYLGGIPMIADDMMTFIKSDIIVFGLGVLLFIIATLWFVFRKLIWVIVPISSCLFSVVIMMGLLGILGWKVTVISSNFIALMLILTMAMNIHMSTRFLQLKKDFPAKNNFEIISLTTNKMFWPILYTVFTTVFAFLSLIFSGIKPIIDFGWMMTFGLITSFVITFTLLPTLLNFAPTKNMELIKEQDSSITSFLGLLSLNNKTTIFGVTGIIVILSVVGISKLEVENSFINYFNKNTEIYKGMKLIDEELGGTTPLEVILKFPVTENKETTAEDDEFEDWGDDEDENDEKYWFTKDKIDKIASVHNYLDNLPQVGKVLSFSSIIEVATQLNNNKPLGTLEMGVLYSKIPESIKTEIIDPYLSIEDNEARVSLRIIDSQENLRRNELINKINFDLKNKIGLKENEYKLAGVLILFNNLLQSLFKSQILTLGLVMIGILSMFIILFRNIKLSLIGVVPNFIAAFFILGIIGLLGIPLDMMTITIAAITIGIAVDNSIHYIYRFKEEFSKIKDYNKTLKKCHSTVGVAILNTSITIVFGFSILVLSKFIPTIYFGVFTGIAMLLAMISVLTLLPALILTVKPFGK
ncbi:MMPL family transporter [Candidatus Pelagibacter sp.]|jgi:predicted RND superfamily exporter protein|uniref:efflux RND transporter permease subunit n=1 Tax=uncultured Candidatus Pelagibacter sp. TaxID=372654 RepID=UPI002331BB4D|nr:MMPL family transporter [uncultured Candidatus Pelagibacter sp.]MDB3946903.1 MMPL family transporter [Candidatus Pelagibacter sp.]MDB4812079.1 MMPL family transporter [Candidatus Pelagibacter sp.]MDC0465157.1 MMPL family transporter [Candidatus Pelagibacter sp.]